jgi:hypothetical protein
MAQNKLENQIREKLNSREIQPSTQAWDRLDAMLTVAEEKKTKRSSGWLYIAAGILVFVSAGMFFFSQNGAGIQPQNSVVGTEVQKEEVQKEGVNPEAMVEAPIVEENQQNQEVVSNEPTTDNRQPTTNNQSVSIINQKTTNESSNQNQPNNPMINRDKEIEFQNSSDVAQKGTPKIMDRKPIVVENPTKTQSDEQLLASLDKAVKKSNKQPGVKVDAKNLLSQVDGELEMTFREKVINKVSKKYKEIEVVLANRNNE